MLPEMCSEPALRQRAVETSSCSSEATPWHCEMLASLEPGETMVLEMWKPDHRKILAAWLRHADTIIGMNLSFDIQYLRYFPEFAAVLSDRRHFLIDLSVVNYLQCEQRPERSLKDIGPVLGTHVYKGLTSKTDRWATPTARDKYGRSILDYNAEDTHNTLLALAALARLTRDQWGHTDKLSTTCLQHYSTALWSSIRKSTNGVPMRVDKLESMLALMERKCGIIRQYLANKFGLHMDNTLLRAGCQKTQQDFLNACVEAVNQHLGHGDIRSHPLMAITPKKGEISFNDQNRYLLRDNLPDDHPLRIALIWADRYAKMQKIIASYLYPLLYHKREVNDEPDRSSVLIPPFSDSPFKPSRPADGGVETEHCVRIAYPTWYIVPGRYSSYGDEEGGQLQARPSCKNPAAQTFPPLIKPLICPRRPGNVIVSYDLSQIELRTAGLLSGEPSILAAYAPGLYPKFVKELYEGVVPPKKDGTYDLHTAKALLVFGQDCMKHPDFELKFRHPAKQSNFTDLYWGGASKLQSILLKKSGNYVPLSVCEQIVESRPRVRPVLMQWQRKWLRDTKAAGYAVLPYTGHSRYFLGGLDNEENEILNFPIQAVAALTLHFISHRLHSYFPPLTAREQPIKPLLNIYDAEVYEIPATMVDEFREMIEDCVRYVELEGYWAWWQDRVGFVCPLAFDFKVHKETA